MDGYVCVWWLSMEGLCSTNKGSSGGFYNAFNISVHTELMIETQMKCGY